MRTFNKSNTQNVKQARKQRTELRKLKMNDGSTITFIETDETDVVMKGLQNSYNYYEDDVVYEGDW